MKATILDGAPHAGGFGERLAKAFETELGGQGWFVEIISLRDRTVAPCAGDFFCWIRTPGVCTIDDDNREITKALHQSDLVVYLTPVTFGGYSSLLKRQLDHILQLLLPFFQSVNGETHHRLRYRTSFKLLCLGWQDSEDVREAAIFRHLVARNRANLQLPAVRTELLKGNESEQELQSAAQGWLQEISAGASSEVPPLPESQPDPTVTAPPRNALLLVGSPRLKKSTSASLAAYLAEQLEALGVSTQIEQVYGALRSPDRRTALLERIDSADFLLLSAPLYVDSLPSQVVELLEASAATSAGGTVRTGRRMAALLNCGFPESAHNATALAICETFARRKGLAWSGSLALGAGEGIVRGQPLVELGGRSAGIRSALDKAAAAIAEGRAIPAEAVAALARLVIPTWLYSFVGSIGWRLQARRYRAHRALKRRPYEAPETASSSVHPAAI